MTITCFNEEVKASNKNCKVNGSAICFFTTFSFCVIFIVEVYTVLIKVYTVFLGKKWVALKRAGCWVALQRTGCWMVWKNGPSDNVTGAVRNDRRLPEHKLRVLFATGQWRRSPRSAGTHAMSQPATVALWPLFCISLGSAVTFIKWSGQIYSRLLSSFLRSPLTKNYWNRLKSDVLGIQCSYEGPHQANDQGFEGSILWTVANEPKLWWWCWVGELQRITGNWLQLDR